LPVNELTQREIDEIINGVEDEELEFEIEDFESGSEEEKEDAKTKDVGGNEDDEIEFKMKDFDSSSEEETEDAKTKDVGEKKMAGEDGKNVTKTQQGTEESHQVTGGIRCSMLSSGIRLAENRML